MREVIKSHIDIGVDTIKLSMSGEEVSQSSDRGLILSDNLTADRRDQACRRVILLRRRMCGMCR